MKRSAKSESRRKLTSECDVLVRKLVLARDGYKCVKCGGTFVLQASHLFSKGKYTRLRFELLNVVVMCVGCHLYWWHKNPLEAHEWLEEKYPGRTDQLRLMAATASKLDIYSLVLCLRKEVKELDPPYVAVHGIIRDEELPF